MTNSLFFPDTTPAAIAKLISSLDTRKWAIQNYAMSHYESL